MGENISSLTEFFRGTMLDYATSFAAFLKDFIGALVILLIGWIVARIFSKGVRKVLVKVQFDKIVEKTNLQELFGDKNFAESVINIISKFVYYFIFLIFLLMATEALGMQAITDQVSALIDFFPKVLIALIIFTIGFYIATFIRDLVTGTMRSVGVAAGGIIGQAIFYFMLVIVSITAMEQLGIDTTLLTSNFSIMIAGIIIGGAISYGFAAKDIMGDILSTFFAKKSFVAGQYVRIGNVTGQIIEINSTNITVLSNDEKIVIPTRKFMSESVAILKEANKESHEPGQ